MKKSVIPMLEDFFENYLPETKGARIWRQVPQKWEGDPKPKFQK